MYHILGCVQHLTPPQRGKKRVTLIDADVDASTSHEAVAVALWRNDIEPGEEETTWQWMTEPTITEKEAQTV